MTRDQAKKLLPVFQAYAEGKSIQFNRLQHFEDEEEWVDVPKPMFDPKSTYRVKPEPKRVPLEAEDIPPVCWLRDSIGSLSPVLVARIEGGRVGWVSGGGLVMTTFSEMKELGWEYSTDLKSWRHCSKEVG